ncbi:MAG: hypothetical protein Q9217_003743 [Psora testacea]
MGSCCSSSRSVKHSSIQNISSPQETLVTVHWPQVDARGNNFCIEEYQLNRQTLDTAFSLMAKYITQQHRSITIIAVEGAVNVLLLQTRQSTHHVVFFGTNLDNEESILLNNAARYAEQSSPISLGDEWFNNQTILCLPPGIHEIVTQGAFQQDEIVFNREGLKILAAPWDYAMCGQMDRLTLQNRVRPYDLSDAVAYLHYYIHRHGGQPVTIATVKDWCHSYQKQTSDDVIKGVNREYRRCYGTDGIIR